MAHFYDSLFMSHISLLIQPEGVEPSANVILSGTETIYREELVNANYDGQNYKLNIRAQDMPRGGSGNLAQERIQTEIFRIRSKVDGSKG